jgi:hypothetical protein
VITNTITVTNPRLIDVAWLSSFHYQRNIKNNMFGSIHLVTMKKTKEKRILRVIKKTTFKHDDAIIEEFRLLMEQII